MKTLAVVKKINVPGCGLDGIMFDEYDDKVILTNHSRPAGTLVAIDPYSGGIVGTAELEDTAPEGAAPNGKGWIYVNNEQRNTIQIVNVKSWKAIKSWPVAPCERPTGIAYDRSSDRIFVGCGKTSVVMDGTSGKVTATMRNGDRVDALGWDPLQRLIYIPGGTPGNVTVVRQDSPDKYAVVATVPTMPGAKTIGVDPVTHRAYCFNRNMARRLPRIQASLLHLPAYVMGREVRSSARGSLQSISKRRSAAQSPSVCVGTSAGKTTRDPKRRSAGPQSERPPNANLFVFLEKRT